MKDALANLWENLSNPVTGSEGVRQILCLLMILGWVHLDSTQQITLISSVSAILSLFTRSSTVSSKRVDQKVDELVAHREMAGQTGTGDGMTMPKPTASSGTR